MFVIYLESQVKTKPKSERISTFVFIVILSYSLWSYRCTDLQGANLHSEFRSATSGTVTKKNNGQHQNVNGLSENLDFQNEVIKVV